MRGRFYSPAWHRFINSDQGVDPNSWNQMAYVGGSPFQSTDPSGMEANATVEVIGDDPGPMYQIDWSWILHWGAISGVSTGSTGGNTGSNVSPQTPQAKADCIQAAYAKASGAYGQAALSRSQALYDNSHLFIQGYNEAQRLDSSLGYTSYVGNASAISSAFAKTIGGVAAATGTTILSHPLAGLGVKFLVPRIGYAIAGLGNMFRDESTHIEDAFNSEKGLIDHQLDIDLKNCGQK